MQQRTARISTLFSNCNIFEQVVAYLMVTSVVAVVGILYLAYNGDRDVSWSEVCTFYGKFCSRAKVALVLHAYQQYCIATISRMVGVWNADIIQHFTETASGSTTIRSFDQESRFMETNLELINAYQQPNLYHIGAMSWPCFRLDILSLVMFAFALVLLITLPGVTNPRLAVMYGRTLNMLQEDVIFTLSNLENKIVYVERILQYACIPHEPPPIIEANRPDPNWPSCGEVEIQNLQVPLNGIS
ncbi:PREDICTED: ABC transporter C family member 3-like [Nelumbo nucifera]|uniref:CASP-like protein n=1 Tax=Nelumbo nucifera TaxID=4432 RepID=A0A1U7ZZG1_NELNU|nr:PREDICTED: ABC transporter C family member 3-like [Nelumbo nucifera]